MSQNKINTKILMSGADFFSDDAHINPYYADEPIDRTRAIQEHAQVKSAFEQAGIEVIQVPPPVGSQDGVYTANWALVRGKKAVLSRLPSARAAEHSYAENTLKNLGYETTQVPSHLKFSGQGDSLICDNYLLAGSQYRSDPEAQQFTADQLGLNLVQLQTIPALDPDSKPITNPATTWPDSFFYDIDLALAIIRPDLIAYCPEAFTAESQEKLQNLPMTKIPVSLHEATHGFACNLLSTGETVIMSDSAPELKQNLESHGLTVITPSVTELKKGGGFIRCVSLTLD
ncbi:arginine deiminase-related protein [Candidatus Saccharibacteria bacterium]|nr:arginine deiminase-related protein [Candidatus Saccharibacteria bacterium]